MQPLDIKPLTGLRFFAAVWVVLFHYWPKLATAATPALVDKGYLGVELFFVLSGFILCHVYLPQAEAGRFRYGAFLWARIARVYPLHLATLAGVGAMALAATAAGLSIDPNILSWASLPANLLMVHAWGFAPQAGWNHPSWSISAEFFAYLSFPLFAAAALKVKDRPLLAVSLALGLMALLYGAFPLLAGFALTKATIAWGALRIVPCFAYGCAVYLLWRSGAVARRRTAEFGALISGAAVLITAATGQQDLVLVSLFGPLILMLASLTSTGSSLGSNKITVYLGEISYSIYMVCIPWSLLYFNAVPKILDLNSDKLPIIIWTIGLAGVVPVAAASYHLIEKPARRQLKTLGETQPHRAIKNTA